MVLLLKSKLPAQVQFFEGKDTGEIAAGAVIGMLNSFIFEPDGVNLVNAKHLAKERGIDIAETEATGCGVYQNRVDVIVSSADVSCRVGGTLAGTNICRLIAVDDADMDVHLGKHLLLLRYPDQPGYVGKFGTIIANYEINIENMEVGCLESRKTCEHGNWSG